MISHLPCLQKIGACVAICLLLWSALFRCLPSAALPADRPNWVLPFSSDFTIIQGFDPPPKPWLSGSRGIWVTVASDDRSLSSPCEGTVIYSGMLAGRPVLSIECAGIHSTFEPVSSSLRTGEAVHRGQLIATIDPRQAPSTDDLNRRGDVHWGAKISRYRYVNPLRMLHGHPRLKAL